MYDPSYRTGFISFHLGEKTLSNGLYVTAKALPQEVMGLYSQLLITESASKGSRSCDSCSLLTGKMDLSAVNSARLRASRRWLEVTGADRDSCRRRINSRISDSHSVMLQSPQFITHYFKSQVTEQWDEYAHAFY